MGLPFPAALSGERHRGRRGDVPAPGLCPALPGLRRRARREGSRKRPSLRCVPGLPAPQPRLLRPPARWAVGASVEGKEKEREGKTPSSPGEKGCRDASLARDGSGGRGQRERRCQERQPPSRHVPGFREQHCFLPPRINEHQELPEPQLPAAAQGEALPGLPLVFPVCRGVTAVPKSLGLCCQTSGPGE